MIFGSPRIRQVRVGLYALALMVTTTPAGWASVPQQVVKTKNVTVRGPQGQLVTASQTLLSVKGSWVRIVGKNFDERLGIYVALCLKPAKADVKKWPHECGGGVNKLGSSVASRWISSNPPSYGVGVAQPFGFGGTFTTRLKVGAAIGKHDCRKTQCYLVTMADHVSLSDRSADVFIPVKFQ